MIIENDIATWTGVMRPEECASLIEYYEKLNDLHLTASRQTLGDNSAHNKADNAAFLLEQPALNMSTDNPAAVEPLGATVGTPRTVEVVPSEGLIFVPLKVTTFPMPLFRTTWVN